MFFFSSRNDESYLSTQGFNDWKNAQSRFKQHECSTNHKQSLITMKTRANLSNRIDIKIFSQLEDEILSYWKNILRRVVAVIKSLVQLNKTSISRMIFHLEVKMKLLVQSTMEIF